MNFEWKQQKMLAGTWHTERTYLVWKIEGKAAKLLMTTFAQRYRQFVLLLKISIYYLFGFGIDNIRLMAQNIW